MADVRLEGRICVFFVAGVPKSMSVGGARIKNPKTGAQFTTRRNTEWAVLVGEIGRRSAPEVPPAGPMRLTIRFFMPRPKTAKNTDLWPIKRPDLDNCLHKLTDQFNGVFWADDAQVVELIVSKSFCRVGRVGAEFTIEEVTSVQLL